MVYCSIVMYTKIKTLLTIDEEVLRVGRHINTYKYNGFSPKKKEL